MKKQHIFTLLLVLTLALTACEGTPFAQEEENGIKASGMVEVEEISVAAELAGRVLEIFADEGDQIKAGDALFTLDGKTLETQKLQAEAALESTKAGLVAAEANLELANATLEAARAGMRVAETQYQITLTAARAAAQETRVDQWDADQPNEFTLPPWYFSDYEMLEAAQAEVKTAFDDLQDEIENFNEALEDAGGEDLISAEKRMAAAQAAFLVAEEILDREIATENRDAVLDYLETLFDVAEAELKDAQLEYEQMLTEQDTENLIEARARLTAAQERYDTALDHLSVLLVGGESLEVRMAGAMRMQAKAVVTQAEVAVVQAEASITQAEEFIKQAEANLTLVELQIEKLTVYAPASGTVLTLLMQPGEITLPGQVVLSVAQLDELTITVYIPEDQYGKIDLGDEVEITADSFTDKTFNAKVTHIADEAEYTPRNVQTEEERKTTVFAIELTLTDSTEQLKPGMPVDVLFIEE